MSVSPPRRRAAPPLAAVAACLLGAAAPAQQDAVVLPPDHLGIKAPRLAPAGPALFTPAPPRSAVATPQHRLPPIPVGAGGNPQPDTPPAREAPAAPPVAGAGAFTYFKNQLVRPTGASVSSDSVVEPCAVNVQDTSFQVGNWYAALSKDQGQTWTNIWPQSFFPALDAGFCCDQRIDYVPSHDITVWLLQYGYSGTTRKGSQRLAIANGRDELRSADAALWTLYDFDPTDFGFPFGTWLDFPDLGFNDDWLYVSANVYDAASAFVGAVVWRVSLYDLQANTHATFSYLTDATMGGNSYRFANRAGDGSYMYWATNTSTTSIRIWRQHTIGINRSFVDRATAAWQWTFSTDCAGPDGRGWLGTATSNPIGRIRGACGTADELVFAWASDGNGTTRPLPYTRVARFRVSDRALIAEHDVYSQTDCWAYAALESNSLGHVGGVFAIGGPSRYVRTSGFLIDQYDAWSQVIAYRMGNPTDNPRGERFGDYFDVQRHWGDPRTLVGTGTFMMGDANPEPRYVWFGRNDYEPAWVDVVVDSAPVPGVAIGIDVTDHNGQKDGSTGFRRTFAPRQGYTVTAPYLHVAGGTTYVFDRWYRDGVAMPLGQLALTIDDTGTTDDALEARYRALRELRIEASPHVSNVLVYVQPNDFHGQGSGIVPRDLDYLQGTTVRLTAAQSVVNLHPFKRWRVGSVEYPLGQLEVEHTIAGSDATATAVYYEYTRGVFTQFGTACDGTNGIDRHLGANGPPDTGRTVSPRLDGGPANAPVLLVFGFSAISWLGIPLPLAVPGAPGCWLNVAMDVTFPAATNSSGTVLFNVGIPDDRTLIGTRVYTQYLSVDPGANSFGMTFSNGLEWILGGAR
jgi:hypothetical protein